MMIEYVIVSLGFVIFFTVGVGIGYKKGGDAYKKNLGGRFVINDSDPSKDVMRIELDMPIAEMISSKVIFFEVCREDFPTSAG